jgi:hypothetical protein
MQVDMGLRGRRLYAAGVLTAVAAVLGGGAVLLLTTTAAAVPVAPPAVVQPTIQDAPTPTVTVTAPVPTVTQTAPPATVTETAPAPTVTEKEPVPTVTVTQTMEPPTVTAPADHGSRSSRPLQAGAFTTAASRDESALAAALAGAAVALLATGGVFAACRAVVYLR